MSENMNIALVQSFYEDVTNLLNALDPEVEWIEMPGVAYGGTYRGPDGVFNGVFKHIQADWEEFGADVDTVLAAGEERVITLGKYKGKFKRTGKSMAADFAHVYLLKNGKIVQFRQYADTAVYNAAMSSGAPLYKLEELRMLYLAMIFYPERSEPSAEMFQRYNALTQELIASGQCKDGNALQPTTTATCLRVRSGKVVITDGPYPETKEQLGGYYLLDCATLDEALEIGARIPDVADGNGSVEIRPILQHE